jgi:transmembrane sensor
MADSTRIQQIFDKYLLRRCSAEELRELGLLLSETTAEEQLSPALQQLWQRVKDQGIQYPVDWEMMYAQIIAAEQNKLSLVSSLRTRLSLVRTLTIKRIAIAASIIIAISTIVYLVIPTKEGSQTVPIAAAKDVKAPAINRATITLADGRIVYLDSAANGQLFTQNNISVIKTADGKIIYNESSQVSPSGADLEGAFNTLSNPRGSRVIDITLSDGSHVWLNANSSITYPVAFIGNERKVSITGEAYFEVTHMSPAGGGKLSNGDKLKRPGVDNIPFIVQKGDMQVTVLGTHFNVKAYDDESDIKVTLLEGRVLVSSAGGGDRRSGTKFGRAEVDLKPGEQARVIPTKEGSPLTIHHSPDLEQTMAWKNGRFSFTDASIETIMRDISRWYNTDIVYEGAIPGRFVADIARDVPVSKLLQILELTNRVHFKIEGNKITVKP